MQMFMFIENEWFLSRTLQNIILKGITSSIRYSIETRPLVFLKFRVVKFKNEIVVKLERFGRTYLEHTCVILRRRDLSFSKQAMFLSTTDHSYNYGNEVKTLYISTH